MFREQNVYLMLETGKLVLQMTKLVHNAEGLLTNLPTQKGINLKGVTCIDGFQRCSQDLEHLLKSSVSSQHY